MTQATHYANTDLDLKSPTPFDTLHRELDQTCCVLHYAHGDDGSWHAIVESTLSDDDRDAALDIAALVAAIQALSPAARAELEQCDLREFNIGFHCGETWAYVHALPPDIVRSVAELNGSIAVTLYPLCNPHGTPKE